MIRRLAAILVVACALMPSALQTRRLPSINRTQAVRAERIAIREAQVGEVRIAEAWEVISDNSDFGGFSAMVLEGPRRFLIASDAGLLLRLRLGGTRVLSSRLWPLSISNKLAYYKDKNDLESLVLDAGSGRLWGGFEQAHRIVRFAPDRRSVEDEVAPTAMGGWDENGGTEALVRFADGQMIALSESSPAVAGSPFTAALLFASDPVADKQQIPTRFRIDTGGRGNVTDAAALPDGRVMLLFRDIVFPSGWVTTLAVADPATIVRDRPWRSRTIARFERPQITENFEGLAVAPGQAGAPISLWMVSDDNRANWQRTLLLRLSWPGAAQTQMQRTPRRRAAGGAR